GLLGRERIGDDMRRGQGTPGKRFRRPAKGLGLPDRIVFERAARAGKLDGENRVAFHAFSPGTSSHFFRCQLLQPSSASCTPLAPSSRFQRKAPSPATCLRNSSHCTLKALSYSSSGTSCQPSKKLIGCAMSGFHTGLGVFS